jgi:esterase/lipase superfamily enzyme
MPRDNAAIENMFNAAKGRFYAFTDAGLLNSFTEIDNMGAFQPITAAQRNQQTNVDFDNNSRPINMSKLKVIGANLGK